MIDLEKIARFARDIHEKNSDGHGFDHIMRVVLLAEKILQTEPAADRKIVLTACYLHDTYDEKLCKNVAQQKEKVNQFLTEIGFDETVKSQIFYIIDNMSFSSNLTTPKALDINGQIVQDADRLDAMGAWGIVRTLEYGWAHERKFYDPTEQVVKFTDKENYHTQKGTTLNHFYEKLFLLKDLLNTTEAQKIGEQRDKIMHDFVNAIEREYTELS